MAISTATIRRKRGDTFRLQITIKTKAGALVDITGFSFLLTVDPSADPIDATNNLFQIVGVIFGPPADGVVHFPFTVGEADQNPDSYFFDVQQTDGTPEIRTIFEGPWIVDQDITK